MSLSMHTNLVAFLNFSMIITHFIVIASRMWSIDIAVALVSTMLNATTTETTTASAKPCKLSKYYSRQ